MSNLVSILSNFFALFTGSIVGRVLAALGLGIVTLEGVEMGIDALIARAQTLFTGIGSDILALVTIAGIPRFLSIVISAYLGIITLRVLWGGFKRLGFSVANAED